jgi:hypothetical protein
VFEMVQLICECLGDHVEGRRGTAQKIDSAVLDDENIDRPSVWEEMEKRQRLLEEKKQSDLHDTQALLLTCWMTMTAAVSLQLHLLHYRLHYHQ